MEKDVCELQILSLRRSINKMKKNMFEIKKATLEDIELINKLAEYGIGLNEVKSYEVDEDFFNSLME